VGEQGITAIWDLRLEHILEGELPDGMCRVCGEPVICLCQECGNRLRAEGLVVGTWAFGSGIFAKCRMCDISGCWIQKFHPQNRNVNSQSKESNLEESMSKEDWAWVRERFKW
jgi:hypothetical protein